MKEFTGNPEFPIWLIGDSPPENWSDKLDTPLDPRHPTRHSIWTSVADSMQDRLYRQSKLRVDTSRLYIRNAVDQKWKIPYTVDQIQPLREAIQTYKPKIIFTFGISAFFAGLQAADDPNLVFSKTTKFLGEQFRLRIERYGDDKVNVIPLLHASIARGRFLESHRDFVGTYGSNTPNYFDYVGTELANLLLARFSGMPIWIR